MSSLTSFLFLSLLGGLAQAAEPAAWSGKPHCRIAPLLPAAAPPDAVLWSGACKDGYASGSGLLEWQPRGEGRRRLDGTLVRGEIVGEASLVYDGGKYIGSVRQGLPHGAGYFVFAHDGGKYEGGVVDGQPEGSGVYIALDGSTYEGQWQAGKRHGKGKASFTLGGSYDGEWRMGKMHGRGTIVYIGGRTHTGEFVDGRAAEVAPPPAAGGDQHRSGLKEDIPSTGSNIRHDRVTSATPLDASWHELTPEQQARTRRAYPALHERDEPPYPLKGMRAYSKAMADLYRQFQDYQGDATVYVTVGADGVPVTASTYGVPHREFARYLATIGMMQRFKPAICGGKPCEAIFPLIFNFELKK